MSEPTVLHPRTFSFGKIVMEVWSSFDLTDEEAARVAWAEYRDMTDRPRSARQLPAVWRGDRPGIQALAKFPTPLR